MISNDSDRNYGRRVAASLRLLGLDAIGHDEVSPPTPMTRNGSPKQVGEDGSSSPTTRISRGTAMKRWRRRTRRGDASFSQAATRRHGRSQGIGVRLAQDNRRTRQRDPALRLEKVGARLGQTLSLAQHTLEEPTCNATGSNGALRPRRERGRCSVLHSPYAPINRPRSRRVRAPLSRRLRLRIDVLRRSLRARYGVRRVVSYAADRLRDRLSHTHLARPYRSRAQCNDAEQRRWPYVRAAAGRRRRVLGGQ